MSKTGKLELLGVYLETGHSSVRVGDLARSPEGMMQFVVDESYIALGQDRPVLSSSFLAVNDEERTVEFLRRSTLMQGGRQLPPWFMNLLPEGALRSLIETGMPTGKTDDFEMLKWVGSDLPGAVVVRDENNEAFKPPVPTTPLKGPHIRFSLAGVQMKMSMLKNDESLTLPAFGLNGNIIAKLPSAKIPHLPEVEYASMMLARASGVSVPNCELVPVADVHGLPGKILEDGATVLAVDRFDRTPDGMRIHMEDFNQIMGVVSDRKYTAANDETIMKIAKIYGGGPAAFLQASRRVAVNILMGNSDAHLKNWALWYPEPSKGELSPAYDIVAYAVYDHSDEMALRFRNTRNSALMDIQRFQRAAEFAGIKPARVVKEIRETVEEAADTWKILLQDLPMPEHYAEYLIERTQRLALTKDFDANFGIRAYVP
ncbi:Serine/threonine-protein kinase HipA [compost metagenome]